MGQYVGEFQLIPPPNPAEQGTDPAGCSNTVLEELEASAVIVANEIAAEVAVALQPDTRTNWLKKHWRALALGGLALGIGMNLALSNVDQTSPERIAQKTAEVAPWAIGGALTAESLWLGGAALASAAAGRKVGNPLTLHKRWPEISQAITTSPVYQTGLAINTLGALGTAGVAMATAVEILPPEAWPGALAIVGADVMQTVTTRALLLGGAKAAEQKAQAPKVAVRQAVQADIERLVSLDLRLFKGAYGATPPPRAEVEAMFRQRLANNPDGMVVAEVGGEIKGFVTAFRTNVAVEGFTSWEESTANGTLNGKVDPDGKYMYIANLTMDTNGSGSALDVLLAEVVAKAIRDGVEYGYFCSRMPGFRRWVEAKTKANGLIPEGPELDDMAATYSTLRRKVDKQGKRTRPYDPELSFYESLGFERQKLVSGGFEDYKSMGYEVLFKAFPPVRWARHIKPMRTLLAAGLHQLAKHPKLLERVS